MDELDNFDNENTENNVDDKKNEDPENSVRVEYKDPKNVETKEEFKLPENFKDVEALHNSYVELQRKLSAGEKLEGNNENEQEKDDKKSDNGLGDGLLDNLGDDNTDTDNDGGSDDDNSKGIDEALSQAEEKFKSSSDKELDKESMDELKKEGLSESMIKNMVKGWNADKQEVVNAEQAKVDDMKVFAKEIYDGFGGKENYDNAFKWLKTQDGGQETVDEYKALVKEGKKGLIKLTLDSIKKQYNVSAKVNGSTATGNDVFQTRSDYHAEIQSYKYKNDRAYQDLITEKAKRSGFLGK